MVLAAQLHCILHLVEYRLVLVETARVAHSGPIPVS